MKKSIIVITSKSAGGKTTLMDALILVLKALTIQSVTTRARRAGDKDTDYEFISFFQFCLDLFSGKFVSWRKATKKWFKTDDFYSVRVSKIREALSSSEIYVRSLTPDTIKRWNDVTEGRIIFIHLLAPDEEEARRRMVERGGMTPAQIDERIMEEKNWDEDINALKEAGIPIHIIPQYSPEKVLQATIEIIESYQ